MWNFKLCRSCSLSLRSREVTAGDTDLDPNCSIVEGAGSTVLSFEAAKTYSSE